MKYIFIIGSIFVLIVYSAQGQDSTANIIEIPFEIIKGYGPFYPHSSNIRTSEREEGDFWIKTNDSIKGIPDGWENAVISQIWFDADQFVYQNYIFGKITKKEFSQLSESWDIDSSSLSKEWLKSHVNIAIIRNSENAFSYILDVDNDLDFKNNEVREAVPMNFAKMDSLALEAIEVNAEKFIQGKIIEESIPVFITSYNDQLIYNFPYHGKTKFKNKNLYLSSSEFLYPFFDQSYLIASESAISKTKEVLAESEYIVIDGINYQHIGVDQYRQTLKLKKVSNNQSAYSTQIGFKAHPFNAREFTSDRVIKLDDYNGKYLFLEFWGTWCKPCIKEIPNLKNTYSELDKSKIAFLSVAFDQPEELKEFLEKNDLPWDHILSSEKQNLVDLYKVDSYPTSFLIDENGVIVAKDLRGENLLSTINKIIE